MPNTIVDHTFAGRPEVREGIRMHGDPGMVVVISDGDPDSTRIWLRLRSHEQLDALIHGLRVLQQEMDREERVLGIGASQSSVGG